MSETNTLKQQNQRKLLFPRTDYAEENPETHIPNILKSFNFKADNVFLKFRPDAHQLSVEQQAFFMQLTEGVFGYNEQIRNETLKTLMTDYNVKYLAPNLTEFIKQTVHLNLAFVDLTLLIYTVRMAKSFITNPHVEVKYYLHDIIPSILSCVLSKKISKYYYDNHWTLRDFSAYLIATICHVHGNEMNQIKQRIMNVYMKPIHDYSLPLSSLYGALKGLSSLGEDVVKERIIPNLYELGKRIYKILGMKRFEEKQQTLETKRVCDLIVSSVGPILIKQKNVHDGNEYIRQYGYFGYLIFLEINNFKE